MGERRVVYGVLVGKREGKPPLGRPRYMWEDNINMDLQEVGGGHGLDEPSVSINPYHTNVENRVSL